MTYVDPSLLESLGIYGEDQQTFADQNQFTLGTPPPPAPGTPAAVPTGAGGIPLDQQSGSAIVAAILKRAGLGDSPELAAYAAQLTTLGLSSGDLQARLDADINDPTSTPGKVIAQKYPALIQHNQTALQQGLPQLNVGNYLATKQANLDVITASGLGSFYDPNKLADQWITGFVSPAEAKGRIDAAVQAVYNEQLDVRAELSRMFGTGDSLGAATAYFLDPNNALPKIQQQLQAGELGAASNRAGFGLLTPAEATQLAQQGVSAGQAQQGFGTLASEQSLFNPLPGEPGAGIDRATQLGAAFGNNALDQQLIERQRQARINVFGSRAGLGANATGVVGLGSAAT